MDRPLGIEIKECYRHKPAVNVKRAVERLLAAVPPKYLNGLKTVVVTDSHSLSHNRRREKAWHRGKKVILSKCQGLYHSTWKGEPAWIEILVDNVLNLCEDSIWFRICLKIPLFRDFLFAKALYHEVGHHIQETRLPERGERENVADRWEKRLFREFLRKKYWYIGLLLVVLGWPVRAVRRIVGKRQ